MTHIAPTPWTGRDDGPGPDHARWHTTIAPAHEGAAAGTVLIGFASDEGVRRNLGRPGAAAGPEALRRALAPLALRRPIPLYDDGDVRVDGPDLEGGQAELGARVASAIAAGHFPVVLGGGHEVAYASYLGIAAGRGTGRRIGVLNLDAHFDLRDAPRATSGTGFAQIAAAEAERGQPFRYSVVGISETGNTNALFRRAEELGVRHLTDDECSPAALERTLGFVRDAIAEVDDVYLTLDLDVLPAWVAPGVSAPAALGVAPEVIQAVVEVVAASGKLALFDVAELNPSLDVDGRTARVAARMIHRVVTGRAPVG